MHAQTFHVGQGVLDQLIFWIGERLDEGSDQKRHGGYEQVEGYSQRSIERDAQLRQ